MDSETMLKPCPFCGGEAFVENGVNSYAGCGHCMMHFSAYPASPEAQDRAAMRWNTRTPAPVAAEGGIPAGWRLVPVEMTEEMRVAGNTAGWLRDKWAAMLAAAPQPHASRATSIATAKP